MKLDVIYEQIDKTRLLKERALAFGGEIIVMKTINWSKLNFQKLDRPKHSSGQKSSRNTSTGFRRKLAQKLEDLDAYWLKFDVYAEPKVSEKKDRYGNTYYRVYDSQRDRYLDFNSEDEVRWWLDKRYYL